MTEVVCYKLTVIILSTDEHPNWFLFFNLWCNQVWHRLEEGCLKPRLGMWVKPQTHPVQQLNQLYLFIHLTLVS